MKKLTLNQIKSITLGAVRVEERGGMVRFCRFTKEQEEIYEGTGYTANTVKPVGVRLSFRTNSKILFLRGITKNVPVLGVHNSYPYAISVFKDGEFFGEISNSVKDDINPVPQTYANYPLGSFEKYFNLGDGEKTVQVYLPWGVQTEFKEIIVDDNAKVTPIRPLKKILIFGDSITQGAYAKYPHKTYASRLCDYFGVEGINKGIGGDVYRSALGETKDDFIPEFITVSYGSNDFNRGDKNLLIEQVKGFYDGLTKNYKGVQIFTLTPIWRKDENQVKRDISSLKEASDIIKEIASKYENVKVIDCYDFVPHDEKYFGDGWLHPNDMGFDAFSQKLIKVIEDLIDKK